MLSLPLIIPRDDNTLWPTPRPQQQPSHNSHSHSQQSQQQRRLAVKPLHARPLSLPHLQADENLLAARKHNVRRFGAGWLRPPGVAKTLQALQDEAEEKREQEEAQRREQALMEQMAAEEERAAREELMAEGAGDEEERDLDEEIPEAEEDDDEDGDDDDSDSDDDDDDDEEEEESEQDVTFEESALEGSVGSDIQRRLDLEEAEMTGAAEEARDLDDDVPEAGSYEHTDSEIEDSSEEEEMEERDLDDDVPEAPEDISMVEASGISADLSAHSARSARSAGHRVSGHSFLSDTGSSVPGSSFLDTSPVAGRGRGAPSAHARRAQAMERMQTRMRRMHGNPSGRGA